MEADPATGGLVLALLEPEERPAMGDAARIREDRHGRERRQGPRRSAGRARKRL
jgi:hypothetical protein